MRRWSLILGVITTLASSGAFAAPDPRLPAGPWHIDYDEAQCVAIRQYGTDQAPISFVLKPSPNGGVMRMIVVRKGGAIIEQDPVTVHLGSETRKTHLLQYEDAKNNFRIVSINIPMPEFRASEDMPSLTMSSAAIEMSLAMSGLPRVLAEFDKCLLDLQDYWNVGDAYKSRIAKAAEPLKPLRSLFSSSDYPGEAMSLNQEGEVLMTFLIDPVGKIADCSVDQTSGIPTLDTMSCYVVSRRAKFNPALGADGKPVRSGYQAKIHWRIGL